jgi:phosphopantetheinyl transferase (holo-ACP synthase)
MRIVFRAAQALVVTSVDDGESFFSKDELLAVRAFRLEKRRRQWMLSRIAEKELRKGGAVGNHVSFSHSGDYGAAAVGPGPIGIDIEVLRDLREHAAHLFLTDEETGVMEQCRIPYRLLHFWCAKEALWKQRGGAVPTLKGVPLRLRGESATGLQFEGVETVFSEVIVALTGVWAGFSRPTG